MKRINIDIETFSSEDLNKVGVYKYAESPDFAVLLFGYSVDHGPKIVVDLTAGEKIPDEILAALEDPNIAKYAYNASFERICLSHYLGANGRDYGTGKYLDPNGWHCTKVQAMTWGLPGSLAGSGAALDISDKKLDAGKELIAYFCKPCKPTAANGGITRHMPVYDPRPDDIAEAEVLALLEEHDAKVLEAKKTGKAVPKLPLTDMQKWTLFKYYNKRDVVAEEEIGQILDAREETLRDYHITLNPGEDPDFYDAAVEREYRAYCLDQRINDRGVKLDIEFVKQAIKANAEYNKDAISIMKEITGLENPNSNTQLIGWLTEQGVMGPVQVKTIRDQIASLATPTAAESALLRKLNAAPNEKSFIGQSTAHKLVDSDQISPTVKALFSITSLDKASRELLLDENYIKSLAPEIKEVLELKEQTSKTSVKKFETMLECACSDGRARGLFQFYGASKTGRFAGRLIQLQNLSKNVDDDEKTAEIKELLKTKGYEGVAGLDKPVPQILSELVRTALIPDDHCKLADADFSAIEARVLAWLANVQWRLDAFANGEDIYCASASQMFGVPVEKHGANSHLRKKGKVAELALGYGGGVNALKRMGGDKMGLTDDEMEEIKQKWRKASPEIPDYWRRIDAAMSDVASGTSTYDPFSSMDDVVNEKNDLPLDGRVEPRTERVHTFILPNRSGRPTDNGILMMRLPSGRYLAYPNARVTPEGLVYDGTIGTTGKFGGVKTYGAIGVENITQATARDILVNAMLEMEARGIPVIAHIHDEVVCEVDEKEPIKTLQEICDIMANLPDWANNGGLLTPAEGFVADFFLKSDRCDAKSDVRLVDGKAVVFTADMKEKEAETPAPAPVEPVAEQPILDDGPQDLDDFDRMFE